jgi:hypothetical protein
MGEKLESWACYLGEGKRLYCIPSLRRTLPSGCRLWYFHFAQPSRPQHNWALEEKTRIASRGSLAIEYFALELIFFCFDLLVGEGGVEVGIRVIHRIVLQTVLLLRKCSIRSKTQFAILYRLLLMICSQPISLDDRGNHLCRDGGAEGRYFESADGGAGLTHAPIFGVQLGSACSLAIRAQAHHLMTRCESQVWRGSAYTYTVAVVVLSLYNMT